MLAVIVVLIAVQIWNSTFRQGSTGQSWGKQVAKTRLIDEWTGRPLGAGRAFLRLLAHLFDSAPCYLGWLFLIWDRPKRQTFADKIMHTIVVPAGAHPNRHNLPWLRSARWFFLATTTPLTGRLDTGGGRCRFGIDDARGVKANTDPVAFHLLAERTRTGSISCWCV